MTSRQRTAAAIAGASAGQRRCHRDRCGHPRSIRRQRQAATRARLFALATWLLTAVACRSTGDLVAPTCDLAWRTLPPASLAVGETASPVVHAECRGTTDIAVRWQSTNPDVVSIDSLAGTLTARSGGTATISVTVLNAAGAAHTGAGIRDWNAGVHAGHSDDQPIFGHDLRSAVGPLHDGGHDVQRPAGHRGDVDIERHQCRDRRRDRASRSDAGSAQR